MTSSSRLTGITDEGYSLRLTPSAPADFYRFETCHRGDAEERCVGSFISESGEDIIFELKGISTDQLSEEEVARLLETNNNWGPYSIALTHHVITDAIAAGLVIGGISAAVKYSGMLQKKQKTPWRVKWQQRRDEKRNKKLKNQMKIMRDAQKDLIRRSLPNAPPAPLFLSSKSAVYSEDFAAFLQTRRINIDEFAQNPFAATRKARTSIPRIMRQFHVLQDHHSWHATAQDIIAADFRGRFLSYFAAQKGKPNTVRELGKFARWNHRGFIQQVSKFVEDKGVSPRLLKQLKVAWPHGPPIAAAQPTGIRKFIPHLPNKKTAAFYVVAAAAATAAFRFYQLSSKDHRLTIMGESHQEMQYYLITVLEQGKELFALDSAQNKAVPSVLTVQKALGNYLTKLLRSEHHPAPHKYCYPGATMDAMCLLIASPSEG